MSDAAPARQDLLDVLRERINKYLVEGDTDGLLSADTSRCAQLLVESAADIESDFEVCHAVGWLFWCTSEAHPGRRDLALPQALWFFERVYSVSPEAIPEQMRLYFKDAEAQNLPSPEAVASGGREMLSQALTTNDPAALDRAILLLTHAADASQSELPDRSQVLNFLAIALWTRFDKREAPADLDQAINVGQECLGCMAADHSDRLGVLNNLGLALRARYQRRGVLDDLNRAIDVGQQAFDATAPEHPHRPAIASNLGSSLLIRFERTGALADVDRTIALGQEALDATAPNHPNRGAILSNLGAALRSRFTSTGSLADIDRAVEMGRQSVEATPEHDSNWAGHLFNLAKSLRTRFGRTGILADIDEAINVGEIAIGGTSTDHPDRATFVSELKKALSSRFERTRNVADLDSAVARGEETVHASMSGRTDRPGRIPDLWSGLLARFEATGDLAILDEAIELCQSAADTMPPDHPDRPDVLNSLAAALAARYEQTEDLDDLQRAIDIGETALGSPATDNEKRPILLSALAVAYTKRFGHSEEVSDLDHAVVVSEQAVNLLPPNHPLRPETLGNLGIALLGRFLENGDQHDLERAIGVGQDAVDSTEADDLDRFWRLKALGETLMVRFRRTAVDDDLRRAISGFKQAAEMVTAPVHDRVDVARRWGRAAVNAEHWSDAVDGFSCAVELSGLLASPRLGRGDQSRVAQFAGLGTEAAAACLQAGQPRRAVELFEQGRGVMFSQLLDAHSDLVALHEADPDLAARFVRWRDEVNMPAGGEADDTAPETKAELAVERRREAAAQFQLVLGEIRALPTFTGFLAPRKIDELLPAAGEGAVVLLNIASLRCDAMILTRDGVDTLPLADVTPAAVAQQVMMFLHPQPYVTNAEIPERVKESGERVLASVLTWLGERIADPVLERLGHTCEPPDNGPWPRIWWCPSGPLSLLPMHAAGRHELTDDAPISSAVIDRVISTTIPTLRALLDARLRPIQTDPRAVVVAMPTTPGHADLSGAEVEAHTLSELLPGRVDVMGLPDGKTATFGTVMEALPQYAWAHFSCHGESDAENPAASCLVLSDYTTTPLTVRDLAALRLKNAELAFLSACTTARTPAELPDEPIHLAAACQMAGYRHVIASLWPIGNTETAKLAKRFYTTIVSGNVDEAATALHNATRRLRLLNRPKPSRWAPYTHCGP